jgi:hypothetical protein
LLDLQCSGSDAPIVTPYRLRLSTAASHAPAATPPSRESGFVLRREAVATGLPAKVTFTQE